MVKSKPKVVHYWLAELVDPETPITLSDEHTDYEWGGLEATKALSGFEDMNICLDSAESFLSSRR